MSMLQQCHMRDAIGDCCRGAAWFLGSSWSAGSGMGREGREGKGNNSAATRTRRGGETDTNNQNRINYYKIDKSRSSHTSRLLVTKTKAAKAEQHTEKKHNGGT